jgi:thiol-disulfide isomerase/thioredoxin
MSRSRGLHCVIRGAGAVTFYEQESDMAATEPSKPKQVIGGLVPEVSLPLIGGSTRTLSSFVEGRKGAVVVFWSETCSHCIRYDPYLNAFAEKHPEIALVAIASRHGENSATIEKTARERGLRFPILHDSTGTVARQWFTQQTPRVFLLDSGKRLLYRGAIDNFKFPADPEYQPYLEPAIEAFLNGKPIERAETASFGCAVESVYYILPKPLA